MRGSAIAKKKAAIVMKGGGTPRSARSLQLHGAKKKARFRTAGHYKGSYPKAGVTGTTDVVRKPVRFPVGKSGSKAGIGGEVRGVSRSFL